MTWGNLQNLTHQSETLETYLKKKKMLLFCLLTTLRANSQLANTESKGLLSGSLKGTSVIGESMVVFCRDKDCFHPIGPLLE